MAYEIKQLRPRHYRVMDLVIIGVGRDDIASDVGVTPRMVTYITQSPVFQDELARRRDRIDDAVSEARARLAFAAVKAADTLAGLLDSPDPMVRLKAAREILDRVGIDGGSGTPTESVPLLIDSDSAERLRGALIESRTLALSATAGG